MSGAGLDLGRIWRGHVQPILSIFPERTAFVDATTERGARLKIAAAVAGLEGIRPEDVDDRIYNVKSARRCIDDGQSEDHEMRLFEIGWGADGIVFVEDPLFLLQRPGPLAGVVAHTSGGATAMTTLLRVTSRICTKPTRMPMATPCSHPS